MKYKNFLNKNFFLVIILIILFFLPFFWSKNSLYNLGGDDSRLYTYSPVHWIKNVSLYSWFNNGLSGGFKNYNPQYFYLPFNIITVCLKFLLPFINLQKIIYGLIIVISFLSIYKILDELIETNKKGKFFIQICAGLYYISFPLFYSLIWPNALKGFYCLSLCPLIFLFFLKAVKNDKIIYLFIGAGCSLIFSIALFSIPFLIPFFIGYFLFFIFYFLLIKNKRKSIIKFFIFYFLLIFLLNSFWLIPFIHSSFYENHQVSVSLATDSKDNAMQTIEWVLPKISLIKHFCGTSSDNFGDIDGFWGMVSKEYFNFINISILFPIIIFIGIFIKNKYFFKEKKYLLMTSIVFLIILFLMTINIGPWGKKIFFWLIMHIPGFVSLRNFWHKSVFAYGLFYSIGFGLGFYILFEIIKRKWIKCFLGGIIFLVLFIQGVPFFWGYANNRSILSENLNGFNFNTSFNNEFKSTIRYLEKIEREGRVVTIPFTTGGWSIINDQNQEGLFIGGSPIKVLTGKDDFNGKTSFRSLRFDLSKDVKIMFERNNYNLISNFLGILNIKYLVYNSEIYNEHEYDFDQIREKYIWIYPLDGEIRYKNLIDNLPVKLEKTFGEWQIYEFDDNYFLPHIYVPQKLNYIKGDFSNFEEVISFNDYNIRNGILFKNSFLENNFIKEKVNDIFIPISVDEVSVEKIRLLIEQTEDEKIKKEYEKELDLIENRVVLGDEYLINIPSENEYKVFVKKGSVLNNNKNLIIKIGDKEVTGGLVDIEENWRSMGSLKLNEGNYNVKVFNNNSQISVVNPGDIILRATNLSQVTVLPKIEFNKVNPVKYIVNVKNMTESFPLAFLESFHDGWKIYPRLSDEQKITNDKFVSNEIAGTTQNNNLSEGKFYENWFKKDLFSDEHFLINGYANAWWIDIDQLKSQNLDFKTNPDGSYDFQIILEFEPQKFFYIGLFVSGITLIGCIGYLVYDFRKRKISRNL
ncbi:MAG: hypothetical protein PHS07_01245 [Patescibacteria group bacterium]|nr:hypothetical protein [Patescibacteria group bacterium]